MTPDFQVLESQLSEIEMALFMVSNVSMNAALLAGADAKMMIAHLKQHEDNFEKLGQLKAAHIFASMREMVEHASGLKPTKY